MRQLMVGVGALALGGLIATFALQEVSDMVVAQATGQEVDVAAVQGVPATAPVTMPDVEYATEDTEALASWYAEEALEESEPEFDEEESAGEERSEYEERAEEDESAEEGEPTEQV